MSMRGHNAFGASILDALNLPRFDEAPVAPPGLPPANPMGFPPPSALAHQRAPAEAMPKMGRGQLIAGILADALAGAQGKQGQFAAMMGQRQQAEQEEAKWHRQRTAGLEDFEAQQRIKQQYDKPDVAPMVRDVQAYMGMTPEQQAVWTQMNEQKRGDPDVFVTLPNGQVYAGPKSGLSQALMGGPQAPPAPVGRLTPVQGGQTATPSGTFRP